MSLTEAPNTSVRNLSSHLQKVSVLVYDPDPPIAGIIRQVLIRLGFGKVYMADSPEHALDLFLENPIDFIITEKDNEPIRDGLSLISFIRTSPDSAYRTIPIIMLSGFTEESEILEARDNGITEFAAKPFTAKSLSERIIRIIENPRSFIITKRFTGPDRRHREEDETAEGQARRRSDNESAAAAASEALSDTPSPIGAPVYSGGGKVVKQKEKNIFKRLTGK